MLGQKVAHTGFHPAILLPQPPVVLGLQRCTTGPAGPKGTSQVQPPAVGSPGQLLPPAVVWTRDLRTLCLLETEIPGLGITEAGSANPSDHELTAK